MNDKTFNRATDLKDSIDKSETRIAIYRAALARLKDNQQIVDTTGIGLVLFFPCADESTARTDLSAQNSWEKPLVVSFLNDAIRHYEKRIKNLTNDFYNL